MLRKISNLSGRLDILGEGTICMGLAQTPLFFWAEGVVMKCFSVRRHSLFGEGYILIWHTQSRCENNWRSNTDTIAFCLPSNGRRSSAFVADMFGWWHPVVLAAAGIAGFGDRALTRTEYFTGDLRKIAIIVRLKIQSQGLATRTLFCCINVK